MHMSSTMRKFITHWGEMGTKWGINRTVAQIHALLYLSPKPLNAEEITSALKVARSNVSNSLKELLNWGIIKSVHELGDRKEKYESMKNVCEMFRVILEERKKREIDPTLQMIKECVSEIDTKNKEDQYAKERLKGFEEFFETTTQWYDRMKKLPMDKIMNFVKLEGKIKNALKG